MRELAQGALGVFAAGLWQGPLVVLLLLLLFRCVPRLSAGTRAALWVAAFALLAVVPLLHLRWGGMAAPGGEGVAKLPVVHVHEAWGYGLLGCWIALALVRASWLARQGWKLHSVWRRAEPIVTDEETRDLLRAGARRAELCASSEVDAPVVIGFRKPRLLLPADLAAEMGAGDLEQIALHEMEHLRRRDDWINLAQKIALVFLPLHPALPWVDRRLSRERELACDAGVVAQTAAPLRYAACLARLAEHRLRGRMAALALAAWSRRPELLRRVETLLRPVHGMSRLQARLAMGLVLAGLGATAAEMARAPQLIELTGPKAVTMQAAGLTSVEAPRGVAASARARGGVSATPVVYQGLRSGPGSADRPGPKMQQTVYVERDAENAPPPAGPAGKTAGSANRPGAKRRSASHGAAAGRQILDRGPHMMLTGAALPSDPHAVTGRQFQTRRPSAEDASPRYVLTIQRLPSYAAVPFGDGWLIVQL